MAMLLLFLLENEPDMLPLYHGYCALQGGTSFFRTLFLSSTSWWVFGLKNVEII